MTIDCEKGKESFAWKGRFRKEGDQRKPMERREASPQALFSSNDRSRSIKAGIER